VGVQGGNASKTGGAEGLQIALLEALKKEQLAPCCFEIQHSIDLSISPAASSYCSIQSSRLISAAVVAPSRDEVFLMHSAVSVHRASYRPNPHESSRWEKKK